MPRPAANDVDPVTRLRAFINDGGYSEGVRLPPERQLTDELGVSRATLRKALDALEREGAIWRHVGKGTFVGASGPDSTGTEHTGDIVKLGRQLTPVKMMRARLAIEPAIAREAAMNASGEALNQMRETLHASHSVSNWLDYEMQDDRFHRNIAEASDNLLLLSLFDQLNEVRRAVAWGNVTRLNVRPPVDHSSFAEHEAIAKAIEERDPNAAFAAMKGHLHSVSTRLFAEG